MEIHDHRGKRPESGYSKEMEDYFSLDLDKAKTLLAEAGYPDGFEVELLSTAQYGMHQATAEVVQANLKKLGIDVTLALPDWAGRKVRALKGDFQFIINGGGLGGAMFPDEMYTLFHSGTVGGDSHGYNDPELDKLLEEGRVTTDPAKINEVYGNIDKHIGQNVYRLVLAYREQGEGVWNHVKGYHHVPVGGMLAGQPLPGVWLEK